MFVNLWDLAIVKKKTTKKTEIILNNFLFQIMDRIVLWFASPLAITSTFFSNHQAVSRIWLWGFLCLFPVHTGLRNSWHVQTNFESCHNISVWLSGLWDIPGYQFSFSEAISLVDFVGCFESVSLCIICFHPISNSLSSGQQCVG